MRNNRNRLESLVVPAAAGGGGRCRAPLSTCAAEMLTVTDKMGAWMRYGYDLRSKTVYGDLSRAEYSYDALHCLDSLRSYASYDMRMQDIKYTYDKTGNVTRMTNTAGAICTLGGSYANHYSYDSLNRLSTAVNGYGSSCELTMEYSHAGRLGEKKTANPDEDLFYSLSGVLSVREMLRICKTS